jgi:hypothetical protein
MGYYLPARWSSSVLDRLGQEPCFHLDFTPTSASWLNLVERFFRDLSQQAILNGSFQRVRDLVEAIDTYLAQHNLQANR